MRYERSFVQAISKAWARAAFRRAMVAGLIAAGWIVPAVSMAGDPVQASGNNVADQLGIGQVRSGEALPIDNVIGLAAGYSHTLALESNGTVWAWGRNQHGQLGDGTTADSDTPVQVVGLDNVIAIGAGWWHSLAVDQDGVVWAWGSNLTGQLGILSDPDPHPVPIEVTDPSIVDVVAVTGTETASWAIRTDGALWEWEGPEYCPEGPDLPSCPYPEPPTFEQIASDVAATSRGEYHTLYLKTDNTVYAEGWNRDGQVGVGEVGDETSGIVPDLENVVAIAAGGHHSLAIKDGGTVWAWGNNEFGQLGDGTTNNSNAPVQVDGLTGVVAVAGSDRHSLAITGDGSLWTWGLSIVGPLGAEPTGDTSPVQVTGAENIAAMLAGDFHSLTSAEGGLVVKWAGHAPNPEEVPALADAVRLSAGPFHNLALKADGSIRAWGANWDYQLGDWEALSSPGLEVQGLSDVVAVAAGGAHSLAVKRDGTVWAWGADDAGQLGRGGSAPDDPPSAASTAVSGSIPIEVRIVEVTYTTQNSTAAAGTVEFEVIYKGLLNDFTGYLGLLGIGGPGAGMTLDQAASAVLPPTYWLGPSSSPDIWTDIPGYGFENRFGFTEHVIDPVLVDENDVLAHFVVHFQATAGEFGTYTIERGDDPYDDEYPAANFLFHASSTRDLVITPTSFQIVGPDLAVQVAGLEGVVDIAAGNRHSLALTANGTVWAWGANEYGQLGDATTDDRTAPVRVQNLHSVVGIAAGASHSLAVKNDGTVWAWGANNAGQLGNGNDGFETSSATPTQAAISDVAVIAAGDYHSLAIKGDGTAWAWGDNLTGQLGDGTSGDGNRSPVPLQVTGLADVIAIAGGRYHSLAVTGDGTGWAWGHNSEGQLGIGTTIASLVPAEVAGVSDAVRLAAGGMHSLFGSNDSAPEVLATWPYDDASVPASRNVVVSFTEPVTNVSADDLFMLSGSAVSAAGGGPGPYFFRAAATTRGPTGALIAGDIADWTGSSLMGHDWTFALTTVMADLDVDEDVDGHDFITFSICYNGPERPIRPACQATCADLDGDGDVDGQDFLTFATCYNRSMRPPQCE